MDTKRAGLLILQYSMALLHKEDLGEKSVSVNKAMGLPAFAMSC